MEEEEEEGEEGEEVEEEEEVVEEEVEEGFRDSHNCDTPVPPTLVSGIRKRA